MTPVHVFHLITELDIGGAQTALLRLLRELDRSRYSPTVACFYNGDSPLAQQIRALDIPVIDLGMTHKWRFDAFWRLYRLLRRERPAILHTWLFHANIPGRVLGRLAGVPIIISSERTMGMESRWRYWLNRLTAPLADRIVCVSQNVARFAAEAIGLPKDKLVVIPNGIPLAGFTPGRNTDLRAALGLPTEALVIGSVARLDPVKDTHTLLQAFASLVHTHPEAHLLLVGDGPERTSLEAYVVQQRLTGRVIFLGERKDVPALLQTMDIFALSSLWEGMPNVALEAQACALPVVATAVGGTPELVVDGVTGLLVPPADPAALARAISTLLRDPDLRRTMGQAGQQRVQEQFDITSTVEKTTALYETLLREKGIA